MTTVDIPVRTTHPVHFRTTRVAGQDIFYREAGPASAPVVLLLHGFPTSSNMFRNLMPRLAGSFRLIAPDYPGFGQSSMRPRDEFSYTFENLAALTNEFIESLGLTKFSMYVMDYGAPIGYRIALLHLERIQALIVQNGNAYEEGLLQFWDPIKRFWAEPNAENRAALKFLVDSKATRWQHENGVKDPSLLDPTTWLVDQLGLDRPGNSEVQMDLFLSYGTNVPLYPKFQEFFRKYQSPSLIVWGKNDFIFPAEGAASYARDLKDVETHLLDTGHFALETHCDEIAEHKERFLLRRLSA